MIRRYVPLLAIAAALALAGCASTASSNAAAAPPSPSTAPSTSAAASATPADCASRFVSWRDNGGMSQLDAVETDLNKMGTASGNLGTALDSGTDPSADEVALQSAAAALQSDDSAAEANLPPSCVGGMRRYEGQAVTDYSKAADDAQNSVSEIGSGSDAVAQGDINTAAAEENDGTTQIGKATKSLQAFNAANS